MEETAALLGSAAIKTRLAGVTDLLEMLRGDGGGGDGTQEAALLPLVLPLLRDHNAKITQSALEVVELLVRRAPEPTVRAFLKLLWLSLAERLGDSKLPVRQKAVDVVVALSEVLDVDTIMEKLKPCVMHKNWRTREQALHALWRCIEAHDLVNTRQSDALDDVVRLLEDSAKEVRDAAIHTLEKFYSYMGPPLLRELEAKNIRSAHIKMLSDRFQDVRVRSSGMHNNYDGKITPSEPLSLGSAPRDALSSILSSYDLQVDSSSSMARYLASVRNRTMNEAKATALAAGGGDRSPSQASSASTASAMERSSGTLGDSGVSVTERDIQKQIATIFDQLEISNDWAKRVDGLKSLQKLAHQCNTKDATAAGGILASLSLAVRTVRERLGEQVGDLRSSVSREACQTIHVLASVLGDEFNTHAEFFMGSLLKATYVTIQVISTSADTSIRGIVNSTTNGYARIIQKFMDGARSRNQVLKVNCVAYLTLTLEQWSPSFLSKNADLFVSNLPALLQDAVGDVRAQSRKCYWAFHHLFRSEANGIYNRLDASTQKNLRDDPARTTSESARKLRSTANSAPKLPDGIISITSERSTRGRSVKGVRLVIPDQSAQSADGPPPSSSSAQRILQPSGSDGLKAKLPASANGPRRVLGPTGAFSFDDPMDGRSSTRMLSQGPKRIERDSRVKSSEDGGSSGKRSGLSVGPLRVLSTPKAAPSSTETTTTTGSDGLKAQRVQVPESKPEQPESGGGRQEERGKRPQTGSAASLSSSLQSDRSSPRSQRGKPELQSVSSSITKSDVGAATNARQPVKQNDRVEVALRSLEHNSWSVRMDAIETIGKSLRLQLRTVDVDENGAATEGKVDDRIVLAFVKHMNDAHYRVSQTALSYMLPLLKLATRQTHQLLPHLRVILSTLFQRVIESKEAARTAAKENLEFIAVSMDPSMLAGLVIGFLGDGNNVKVKVAVCKYLQTLLPSAGTYLRQSNHMRSFLLKLAQLMDGEAPVTLATACGDLISASVQEFAAEMDSVMPVLPPTKRSTLGKVMKARGINLSIVSGVTRPLVDSASTTKPRDVPPDDNQHVEDVVIVDERAGERSRKRAESPTANASPALHLQKRPNTTGTDEGRNPWRDDRGPGFTSTRAGVLVGDVHNDPGLVIEIALQTLKQNNSSERERKKALYQIVSETSKASNEFWDVHFDHVLVTLLDAACDNDVYALKVLLRVVMAAGARAEPFLDVLVERLLAVCGDHSDVSLHLAEAILRNVVSTSTDQERMLSVLTPFLSVVEPPALLAVLQLVRTSITLCGQNPSQMSEFIRNSERVDQLLRPLTSKLRHGSSDVRKNAVDCLVGFFLATEHDKAAVLAKYLDSELDDTRKRLVEIYIDRAKRDRLHHRAGI